MPTALSDEELDQLEHLLNEEDQYLYAWIIEKEPTPPEFDGPMLARIAGSYEAEPARRDDLLQEISLAVWKALPAWRGDASLRTFAARVAHNRALDHLAKEKRAQGDELHDEHPDPVANPFRHAEAHQQRNELVAAVRRLPLGQRQVVVLALEGFSQREIADSLGLEENTVTQRLSRARRQLNDWLGAGA